MASSRFRPGMTAESDGRHIRKLGRAAISRQISPRHNCMHDHIARSRHIHPAQKYQSAGGHARFAEPNEEKDSGFDKRTATTNPKLGENRRRSPLLEITQGKEREKHRNLGSPASLTAPFRDIFRAHISGTRAAVRLSVADLNNLGF